MGLFIGPSTSLVLFWCSKSFSTYSLSWLCWCWLSLLWLWLSNFNSVFWFLSLLLNISSIIFLDCNYSSVEKYVLFWLLNRLTRCSMGIFLCVTFCMFFPSSLINLLFWLVRLLNNWCWIFLLFLNCCWLLLRLVFLKGFDNWLDLLSKLFEFNVFSINFKSCSMSLFFDLLSSRLMICD